MIENIKVIESDDYGVEVIFYDADEADRFEDFLSEKVFALYKTRINDGFNSFLFGILSDSEKVKGVILRFRREGNE